MIAVALKIAHNAVVHHDTLVQNAGGNSRNFIEVTSRTAAQIYRSAEEFKHWRDKA